MKFLIIDTYYPDFLSSLYQQYKNLPQLPYASQWRVIMDQSFGTADFYSHNLKRLGYKATEIVANCEPLQRQWAMETGIALGERVSKWALARRGKFIPWPKRIQSNNWFYKILLNQIKQFRPTVLHIQDMNAISASFLKEIKPYTEVITGQIACPIARGINFKEYDLVLSSFPHFVEKFRKDGLTSEYLKLGFEPKILKKLDKRKNRYQVVFVGGLSASHEERIRFLEAIASSCTLNIWGYGIDSVNPKSPLRANYHGNAWSFDMYNILYNADIVLNHHINVAGNYANNMRLYEATGVGSLLITDRKENLPSLFESGREVLEYDSPEECKEFINYYLEHEEERKTIAQAGQQHTLREHTYYQRMQEFVDIVTSILRKRGKTRLN